MAVPCGASALYPADGADPDTAVAEGRAPGGHSAEFVPTGVPPTLHRAVEAMLTAAGIWLVR